MTKKQACNRRKRRVWRQRLLLGCLVLFLLSLIPWILMLPKPAKTAPAQQADAEHTLEAHAASPSSLPEGYERRTMSEQDFSAGTLVLVNREHSFDPTLAQTVSVYENKTDRYLVKDVELSIRPEAMDALNRWMDAFCAETGKADVNIVAGWRSYEDQQALYRNAVKTKGQAHADAYLALPGHSEHHTGLAVDLDTYNTEDGTSGGFDGDGAYAWAVEHAWEYGFVQRYPPEKQDITGIDYEAWHFRYVGLPHAFEMASRNLCLEEYIDELYRYPFEGEHLLIQCPGQQYEVYFCPAGNVIVPSGGSYSISSNHVDGYIITITLPS